MTDAQTIQTLTAEIGAAVTGVLGRDVTLLRGYSQAKAGAIAGYTLMLGEALATGAVGADDLAEEMTEIDRMVARFVRNIEAIATTAIDRVIRAVGTVLMRVIDAALGRSGLTLSALVAPPRAMTIDALLTR